MPNRQIIELEIDTLQPNPLQPRGLITSDSLADLVTSIKQHGILEPLVVAKTPAGYQIIAGERRWRAAKLVGMDTVPVLVKETSPRGMLEMALVENVQREDLNPIDRAQAFLRLMNEFGLTNKEISDRIGKSPAYVSNSLRLMTLPDALKDGLLTGLITEGHARALAAIEDPNLMLEGYKMVLREAASVRRAEDISRRIRKKGGQLPGMDLKEAHLFSEELDKTQQDIQKALEHTAPEVRVKLVHSRIQTRILIIFNGNPEETLAALDKVKTAVLRIKQYPVS